jgi:hypothetical protein
LRLVALASAGVLAITLIGPGNTAQALTSSLSRASAAPTKAPAAAKSASLGKPLTLTR